MLDGEPVYMKLFEFVFIDDIHLDRTCSVIMGIEMKSPITGTNRLTEIKDWEPTDRPYLFKVNRLGQTTYLVRALGVSVNNPLPTPTPAKLDSNKSTPL